MADKRVFKRGSTWYIRYELPRGIDGKRRQRMEACPGLTQAQAKAKLAQRVMEIERGTYIDPAVCTVAEYMRDWLDRQKQRLSPTSWDSYEKYIRNHIAPGIGSVKLDKLTPATLQGFYHSLADRLAPKSIANVHGILHGALGQAVKLQLLHRNPADHAEPPRVTRKEIHTATRADLDRLMPALEGTPYHLPVLLIVATGMRRGEVLGLQWGDFRPEHRTLAVRRSVCYVRGQTYVKDTKTSRSRVILLPGYIVDELQVHRRTQDPPSEHICPDANGRPMNPQALATAFARVCRQQGLALTLHGLRHTQATDLILAGVPVKVVSERLGHSTVNITQDIYAHVLPHMQGPAADAAERLYGPKAPEVEENSG